MKRLQLEHRGSLDKKLDSPGNVFLPIDRASDAQTSVSIDPGDV